MLMNKLYGFFAEYEAYLVNFQIQSGIFPKGIECPTYVHYESSVQGKGET